MRAAFCCLQCCKKQQQPTSAPTELTKIQGLQTPNPEYYLKAADPRFGPVYGNNAMQVTKLAALNHILNNNNVDPHNNYIHSIADIQTEVIGSYNVEGLTPGYEFQEKMVRDGCFFLLVALYILGGGVHLHFPNEHPYFGENRDLSDWMHALFFVGNQIPYIVIRALMQRAFFRSVIRGGTWGPPPQDPLKLVLYRTVVEPQLNGPALPPPSDIVQVLHSLLLGLGNNDPVYSEMRDFPHLEAGGEAGGGEAKFPSAGELKKLRIFVNKADNGITNISFRKLVFCAYLYVPPLMIDRNTKHMIRCLTNYEKKLHKSDREVTSYFQLMRDLAATHNDFEILERSGIIQVRERDFSCEVMSILNDLVSPNRQTLTLNFRDIRRKIEDFKLPPWEFIAFFFGVCTVIGTVMAILSYVKLRK